MRAAAAVLFPLFALLALPSRAEEDRAGECARLVGAGDFAGALEACRAAAQSERAGREVLVAAARAEFEAGDASRSTDLYERALALEWSEDVAVARADALWRGARAREAEAALRDLIREKRSVKAAGRLVELLMTFGRAAEVPKVAREALRRDPKACAIQEWWGAAEATLGKDAEAAKLFASAVANGCPRYRWTTIAGMPAMLGRPRLRAMLAPAGLLEGIDALPEREALHRLSLLKVTLDVSASLPLASLVEKTASGGVRLEAAALLGRLGSSALSAWQRLLASPNFIARRVALRQIYALNDPAFVPALSAYVGGEKLPGLRALGSLALARLLVKESRLAEAVPLLESIPVGEEVYPVALEELAGIAEKQGREKDAAELHAKAKAAADRQRMIATSEEKAPGVPKD